jgi:hypothetical protein
MLHISYFILVPPESETVTPFQGFNLRVTERDFHFLVLAAACLPNHPYEIFLEQDELLKSRSGHHQKNVATLNAALFSESVTRKTNTLYIILCLQEEIDNVVSCTKHLKIKPIIISNSEKAKAINIMSAAPPFINLLDSEIRRRLTNYHINQSIERKFPKLRKRYNRSLSIPESDGGAIMASEILLKSLGFQFEGKTNFPAHMPEIYRNIVYESAKLALDVAGNSDSFSDVILFAPAISPFMYDIKQNFWNQILRNIKIRWHKDFIIDGLIRNPHYSGFLLKEASADNPFLDPYAGPTIILRKKELLATNMAIALLACATFSIPIRLPNAVNLHFKKLKYIEELAKRQDKKSDILIQKSFIELNTLLKQNIGAEIVDLVLSKARACTICSDLPLEWVYFDKLPLMISHEVSKIPMTPGNMLLQYCSPGDGYMLKREAFGNILVLRSFNEHDPLKKMLEKAVQRFPISVRTVVNFVDVKSKEEVIDAMNRFDGALLVFDCHGSHEGSEGAGFLQIGNEKLNTWELAKVARVPPVVILSACSTSAIGGSHASVANGLLRSGALSVIGTFLPVNGIKSAILAARLIYRLDAFLPALKEAGHAATNWRVIVSTFFRMSYATDFLNYFRDEEKILSEGDYISLHTESNFLINSLRNDWFDQILEKLSRFTGIEDAELLSRIHSNQPLLETMRYCQQGRPELINIYL